MIKTIILPLDGSSLSERALPVGSDLARALGAKLVLVCVAGPDLALDRALTTEDRQAVAEQNANVREEDHLLSVTPLMITHVQEQVRAVAEAERYIAAVQARLAGEGTPAEAAVPYGTAVEGIMTEIEIHHADLVVMSSHGRSGLSRLLGGSVAQAVLGRSPVPVLLVPPER